MTIRVRLTILYTSLLAVALLLFSTSLYAAFRWVSVQTIDKNMEQLATRIAMYYIERGDAPKLGLTDQSIFYLVRTPDHVLARTTNFEGLFPIPPVSREGEAVFTFERFVSGPEYRLYTLPIMSSGEPLFYVQVAYVMQVVNEANQRLRLPLITGALGLLALTGVAAFWVARRAIAPIEQVAKAAREISESADLSLRVPGSSADDEVGMLVSTFNDMLDQLQGLYGRLAASMDAQQRFVADASHELRTPLTIIRGNIDYMQKAGTLDREALADMSSEAERMTRLIEELLTMARADAGQNPDLKAVALGPLVTEACRKAGALPHEVEFCTELPEALDRITVLANGEWLVRVILILIDNAFKYTPSGSVTVRAGRRNDGVVIQVVDTGIGIPPQDLPHIFERFYRADRARGRGGTGLGLAIARWIAGVHGGQLTAESDPGKGSTFSLWLPIHRTQNS